MKNRPKKQAVFWLSVIDVILLGLFWFSYTPAGMDKQIKKNIQSALLNRKYEKQIERIELHQINQTCILTRYGSFWAGDATASDGRTISFPVAGSTVALFIQRLSKLRKMYKISDSEKDWDKFGLQNGKSAFSMVIYDVNGNVCTKIYFSRLILPSGQLTLRSDRTLTMYQTNDDLSYFLNTDPGIWADPFLVPQTVFGDIKIDDIQRVIITAGSYSKIFTGRNIAENLLKLRHGKIYWQARGDVLDLSSTFTIELGNTAVIVLKFYNLKRAEKTAGYVLQYIFKNGIQKTAAESLFPKYRVCLSDWTYERLQSLFKEHTERQE